jgi:hypothetical protein
MSTRACYRFFPLNGPNDWPGVVTVYKHHDGYPAGAAKAIGAALDFAWQLPRFEADEFAAAFVAANKRSVTFVREEYKDLSAKAAANPKGDSANMKDYYLQLAKDAGNFAGGGVRLVPFEGLLAYERFASDIAYLYDIRCVDGKIQVTAFTTSERNGNWTVEEFFEGSVKQLARRKP